MKKGDVCSFISELTLDEINSCLPEKHKYHPTDAYYSPSGSNLCKICKDIQNRGYSGLVEITLINPRFLPPDPPMILFKVNTESTYTQIIGRPIIRINQPVQSHSL